MVVNVTHSVELFYWKILLHYLSSWESYFTVDFLPFGCWKKTLFTFARLCCIVLKELGEM